MPCSTQGCLSFKGGHFCLWTGRNWAQYRAWQTAKTPRRWAFYWFIVRLIGACWAARGTSQFQKRKGRPERVYHGRIAHTRSLLLVFQLGLFVAQGLNGIET